MTLTAIDARLVRPGEYFVTDLDSTEPVDTHQLLESRVLIDQVYLTAQPAVPVLPIGTEVYVVPAPPVVHAAFVPSAGRWCVNIEADQNALALELNGDPIYRDDTAPVWKPEPGKTALVRAGAKSWGGRDLGGLEVTLIRYAGADRGREAEGWWDVNFPGAQGGGYMIRTEDLLPPA
jgi:hypothetical protein